MRQNSNTDLISRLRLHYLNYGVFAGDRMLAALRFLDVDNIEHRAGNAAHYGILALDCLEAAETIERLQAPLTFPNRPVFPRNDLFVSEHLVMPPNRVVREGCLPNVPTLWQRFCRWRSRRHRRSMVYWEFKGL